MNTINFRFNNVTCTLANRNILKQQLLATFKKYKHPVDTLNYILCTDDFLLDINRSSLQHDYYTDIITFDLSEGHGVIGEIYISIDRVRENAISFQTSFKEEIVRVIAHGALHLCGLKDKSPKDIAEMRKAEDDFLKAFKKKVSRFTVSN